MGLHKREMSFFISVLKAKILLNWYEAVHTGTDSPGWLPELQSPYF